MPRAGSQRSSQEEFMLSHCLKMRNTLQDFSERLWKRWGQRDRRRSGHWSRTCECHWQRARGETAAKKNSKISQLAGGQQLGPYFHNLNLPGDYKKQERIPKSRKGLKKEGRDPKKQKGTPKSMKGSLKAGKNPKKQEGNPRSRKGTPKNRDSKKQERILKSRKGP